MTSSSEPDSSFTPDSAQQLPDRELKASQNDAKNTAETVSDPDAVTEAEHKAAVAEEELKRRGTSL